MTANPFWNALQRMVASVGSTLIENVLPATCAGCGRVGEWICDACERNVLLDHVSGCQRCGQRGRHQRSCSRCQSLFPRSMSWVRAGFVYDGPVRRAVQRFKYHGEYRRGYDLGERLNERLALKGDLIPHRNFDALVPIPLHRRRYRMRGFNQSEILAKSIGQVLDVPVVPILKRVRDTHPQVQLRANQRQENMKQAFAVDRDIASELTGASVLIVDDVMTTGATIGAAAWQLEGAGPQRIAGLTLARDR
jgi:ComF family protein